MGKTLGFLKKTLIVGINSEIGKALLNLYFENNYECIGTYNKNKPNIETKNKFIEVAKKINNKTFTFNRESKENGDLYGSIKPKEITNLIKEQTKAEVSPSQIILKDELNKIGIFKVDINFHSEVKANISIKIVKTQAK